MALSLVEVSILSILEPFCFLGQRSPLHVLSTERSVPDRCIPWGRSA
jgi:hypothetical protein